MIGVRERRVSRVGNWEELKKGIKSVSADEQRVIEMMAKIVSQIIVAREELGLSQRQLAELADMNQSALARMETMRVTPRLDTVCHVLSVMGKTLQVA